MEDREALRLVDNSICPTNSAIPGTKKNGEELSFTSFFTSLACLTHIGGRIGTGMSRFIMNISKMEKTVNSMRALNGTVPPMDHMNVTQSCTTKRYQNCYDFFPY